MASAAHVLRVVFVPLCASGVAGSQVPFGFFLAFGVGRSRSFGFFGAVVRFRAFPAWRVLDVPPFLVLASLGRASFSFLP